jgi:hypothetical protein
MFNRDDPSRFRVDEFVTLAIFIVFVGISSSINLALQSS